MTATLIDGKAAALALRARVAEAAAGLSAALGRPPCLAVVLVGEDPASAVYVRSKAAAAGKAGIASRLVRLDAATPQARLEATLTDLGADAEVDGILLQLPLPPGLDADAALARIDPAKDVDGLTAESAGRLVLGRPGLVPCTPQGAVMLARQSMGDLAGARAVVIGRSILVGKPLALLLTAENATVTLAHSRSRDLPALAREADLLCVAVGRPEHVRGDWVRPGATVIDIGINRVGDRLLGDVAHDEAAAVAGALTPVPGGVGPMTVACLLRNTALAAARRAGLPDPAV